MAKALLVLVRSGNKHGLVTPPELLGAGSGTWGAVASTCPLHSNFSAERGAYTHGQNRLTSPKFQPSVDCSELLVRNAEAKNYSWK